MDSSSSFLSYPFLLNNLLFYAVNDALVVQQFYQTLSFVILSRSEKSLLLEVNAVLVAQIRHHKTTCLSLKPRLAQPF
jgi:hypothetical protein